ncbi:bis-aminopropyl spermidine synthase family protein, partial [Fusicatenibacter saccharivorans]|nr:bis-aminopropyl spermidine synthase family protein [Fusicatenibacter saccharivorans]
MLCLANGTLTSRQIVCMGDDDFVSLAIGFLLKELYPGPSICPTHIHVLEMDGRYIECLNRLSERFSL